MIIKCCFFFNADPNLSASVTPPEFTGKDFHPFNAFTLRCTASKPSGVIPALEVNWFRDEMTLDNSVSGVRIREEARGTEATSTITVTLARVVDSGFYTCNVVVNIPESQPLSINQTANVTINGKKINVII